MAAIYRNAFRCVIHFWWLYLLVAVLLTGLPLLLNSTSATTVSTSWGYIFFILFLHRYFLLGEGPAVTSTSNWGFIWVNVLLTFGAAALVLIPMVIAPANPVSQAILTYNGLLVLAFMAALWLLLAIFGTALPASAAKEPFGLALTMQRSRKTALGIAWRLLAGPGLFSLVMAVTCLLGLTAIVMLMGIPSTAPLALPLGVLGFALQTGVLLIYMTASTLAVAVLCDAYRRIQPAPVDAAA